MTAGDILRSVGMVDELNMVVTQAMIEAALAEEEKWSSFTHGSPGEGAVEVVIIAAFRLYDAGGLQTRKTPHIER